MKMKISRCPALGFAAVVMLAILTTQPSTLFAQGSLTPPGAPAAGMKTLAQIEPRTPIASAPFSISVSGSYYLTTNVTVSSGNAINILANNVTVDLNGFTIASTENPAGSGYGIALGSNSAGVTNVTILNGFISGGVTNNAAGVYSGYGFGYGIEALNGNYPVNERVSGVSVSGCRFDGIYLGYNNTAAQSCTVNTVGGSGIVAETVSDSMALNCGGSGMLTITANNCSASSSGSGGGLSATTANNCCGSSGSGTGLFAAASASNCYGSSSSGTGLSAFLASVCHGVSTTGTALSVSHNVNSY